MTIVETITARLPDVGRVVLLCPPALVEPMWQACADSARPHPEMVLVVDGPRVAKGYRNVDSLPVLQADIHHPPLPLRDASCVVAVDILSRTSQADETLGALCQLLCPGGLMIVGERLMRSPTLRILKRITAPGSRRLLPEDVCALMLNADVMEVGQSWPTGHPERFLTWGSLKVI